MYTCNLNAWQHEQRTHSHRDNISAILHVTGRKRKTSVGEGERARQHIEKPKNQAIIYTCVKKIINRSETFLTLQHLIHFAHVFLLNRPKPIIITLLKMTVYATYIRMCSISELLLLLLFTRHPRKLFTKLKLNGQKTRQSSQMKCRLQCMESFLVSFSLSQRQKLTKTQSHL